MNVNESVQIRVTVVGKRILQQEQDRWHALKPDLFPQHYELAEDADGWSRWELWRVMATFGAACGMGKEVPFETTIQVQEPPKDEA